MLVIRTVYGEPCKITDFPLVYRSGANPTTRTSSPMLPSAGLGDLLLVFLKAVGIPARMTLSLFIQQRAEFFRLINAFKHPPFLFFIKQGFIIFEVMFKGFL